MNTAGEAKGNEMTTTPKVPEWVRRALAKRLPAKDMTANTLRGVFA